MRLKLCQCPRVNNAFVDHFARPVIIVVWDDATLRDLVLKHNQSISQSRTRITFAQVRSELLHRVFHLNRSVGSPHELEDPWDHVLFPVGEQFETGIALVFLGDLLRKPLQV